MNQAEFDEPNENIDESPSGNEPEENIEDMSSKGSKPNTLKGNIAKVGGVVAVLIFQLVAAYVIMSYVVVPQIQRKSEIPQEKEKTTLVEDTNQEEQQKLPAENLPPEQTITETSADVYSNLENTIQSPILDPRCVVQYEDIIINLAFTGGDRYFILSIVAVTSNEDAARELQDKDPIIRDFFISWLSKRGEMWYSNFENHDTLRNELKEQISARLQTGYVTYIFFTKYVIQ